MLQALEISGAVQAALQQVQADPDFVVACEDSDVGPCLFNICMPTSTHAYMHPHTENPQSPSSQEISQARTQVHHVSHDIFCVKPTPCSMCPSATNYIDVCFHKDKHGDHPLASADSHAFTILHAHKADCTCSIRGPFQPAGQ